MALIGISGKIGSGKDTVRKIIQGLTSDDPDDHQWVIDNPHQFLNEWNGDFDGFGKWKLKRFADPVKDLVCTLIGCTRDKLEEHEFKNTPLGEEWWFYQIQDGDGIPFKLSYKYNRNKLPCNYLVKPTPRIFMQQIGTEGGRELIHPDIWVNSLMSTYADNDSWIIPDVRFENEFHSIKSCGGILIRVDSTTNTLDNHQSENGLSDHLEWDYVISNDNSLHELVQSVASIVNQFQK